MATYNFNTPAGQTIARKLFMLFKNTGTASAPVWSPVGKRVEDSSMEMDWQTETKIDIFDETWTTGKIATRTQSFEPCELDADDAGQQQIWQLAIVDNDVNALLNQDCLLVHAYAGTEGKFFAERYSGTSILPTSLGGEGGGAITMPIDVTFGGTRTTGTAAVNGKNVTFTADTAAGS